MRAITLSREYGSGGGEIAARLAERLGWRLVDHEVVVHVAKDLGISIDEAEERDDRAESVVTRVLASLQLVDPTAISSMPLAHLPDDRMYARALSRVVEGAYAAGSAVIVGRSGQAVLRVRRDVLHVRVIAPLPQRIRYVARREGLDDGAARDRVLAKDRARARFLDMHYRCRPDDAQLYDLIVNTSVLSLDHAVGLITHALEAKASRLATPNEDLGPGAGVAPYPTAPADLPPTAAATLTDDTSLA